MEVVASVLIPFQYQDYALKPLLGRPAITYLLERLEASSFVKKTYLFAKDINGTEVANLKEPFSIDTVELASNALAEFFSKLPELKDNQKHLCIEATSTLFDSSLIEKAQKAASSKKVQMNLDDPEGQHFLVGPDETLRKLSTSKTTTNELFDFVQQSLNQEELEIIPSSIDGLDTKLALKCAASFEQIEEIALHLTRQPTAYSLHDLIEFSRLTEANLRA